MKIKKGDYVQVVAGESAGERGRVLRVLPETDQVIIEGVNYIYRHVKKTQKTPQGGRVEKEAPIHVSNVMLYCPHCQSVTRAKCRYEEEDSGKEKKEETAATDQKKLVKVRCCSCPKKMRI